MDRSIRRCPRPTALAVAAAALLAGGAAAQMELAVLQGTVHDEEGRPLAGVTVRIRDVERGREVVVASDARGSVYRRGLPAVEYEIVVEKEGYQPIRDTIRLAAGSDRRFAFKLARAMPAGAEEFARGVDAYDKGDVPAAVAAFEAALTRAPSLPEVRINLALAYLRASRPSDAAAQLEQAVKLAGESARVHFQLAGAYLELKNRPKAIAALERGLTLQPDLSDPLAYEAAVTLAAAYFAEGDAERARARYERALAARPVDPAPKLGLGKICFGAGDYEGAERFFRDVAASAPGSPQAAEAEAFLKELEKIKRPGG
jgi:tetratricopeptide (TPR) repeat protein